MTKEFSAIPGADTYVPHKSQKSSRTKAGRSLVLYRSFSHTSPLGNVFSLMILPTC
jgi:hypothetical protein